MSSFKKASVEGKHKVSGKDVKRLKSALLEQGQLDEEEVSSIIPNKAEMTVLKLSNKALVYVMDNGNPVAFDPEGRNDVYPTLYMLWQCPSLLPPLYTHSEVTPKVLGGADLMMPGVIEPADGLGEFSKGQHRAVFIPENPYPLAVGRMDTDSETLRAKGFKGKGLKVWHAFGDPIWALGDKSKPDLSFTPSRVYALGEGGGHAETSAEEAAKADEEGIQGAAPGAAERMNQLSVNEAEEEEEDRGFQEEPNDDDDKGGKPAEEDWFDLSTTEGMDKALEHCFCKALAERVTDADLPIPCEKFYSQFLLPCRPQNASLDVKKSSYKKLPKLVKAMEKKGVVTQKQVHKNDCLYSVNREHELLKGFGTVEEKGQQREERDRKGRGKKGSKEQQEAKRACVEVHPMYKVPGSLRFVFGEEASQDRERLFSQEEVGRFLCQYAQESGLCEEGKEAEEGVMLDESLGKALYGKKEEVEQGQRVAIDDLKRRLEERLQLHNRIVLTRNGKTEEVVRKGSLKNIAIQAEDRHTGRKFITRVTYLEYFAIDPREFAGVVQRTFNTNTSVAKLPGKQETREEVTVQGNLLNELQSFLNDHYGIPPEYIQSKSKLKDPAGSK